MAKILPRKLFVVRKTEGGGEDEYNYLEYDEDSLESLLDAQDGGVAFVGFYELKKVEKCTLIVKREVVSQLVDQPMFEDEDQ